MSTDKPEITQAFCKENTLLFSPETVEEAVFIQRQLFNLGISWEEEGKSIHYVNLCVSKEMVIKRGFLYYNPSNGDKGKGILCTSAQFREPFDPQAPENAYVLSEHRVLLQAFNKLSERIAAMEQKLDRLCAAVEPQAIDKPKPSPASLGPKKP